MKLTLLLLFLTVFTGIAADTYSQSTKLTLKLENVRVEDLLNRIEDQSEFRFFYNDEINLDKKVSVNISDETITSILDKIFSDKTIKYEIIGRQIILTNAEAGLNPAVQPLRKVSGKVVSSSGEAIPGVTVVVKGTSNGTITDADGNYVLPDVPADALLVFSFVGMKSQEIPVAGKSNISIILEEETISLGEVVAIGYGTIKKGDVTSSVASVKSDEFVKGSVKDIGQLVQGKVAGLTITSPSGDPTSNTQIKLRGNTTILGTSTSPLVLIDGVPGDFNTVVPEDIESVDVLKDGSAAAIYGTRGTNGVILITTKRASASGKSSVEYDGYMSTQSITKKLNMLTAADYRQQITDGIRSSSYDLGATTDWLDEITRTPFSHVHNITFRGGNAKTNYLATANYRDLEGIFKESDNNLFTARADINHNMFDELISINLGLLTRTNKYNTSGDGYSFDGYTYRQANIYNPTAPVKNADGSWYEEVGAFNYDNPVARLAESYGENSSNFNRLNSTITVKPIEGLNLKALFSYSKYNQTRGYYETKQHISTKRSGLNGYATNGAVESIDRLMELIADYNKAFGNHHFAVLGGYSYSDNDWRDFWMRNTNFPTDLYDYNNIDKGTGIKEGNTSAGIGSSRSKTNLISFFGRLNYNYNDKYLLMASLRHEAASQLYGTKDPWGTFPAVSLGWRVSQESFMSGVNWVNDLKLRGGYGVTGTQPSDLFLGVATVDYTGFIYSDGEWKQTLSPTRNSNPYLRWEEKRESNIGLDFVVADNRISGNIDYYIRVIDGLLYDYSVPTPPNLVSTTRANVGKMENKGLEILLNVVPVRKKNFDWTSSFNFSTNTNKLKSLSNDLYQATQEYLTTGSTGEPIQTFTHRVDVGGPIGNFYGFKVIDVDENGKWIYEDANGNAVNYDDFDHSFGNKKVLGNGLPKYYAGWNNSIRYKNFDLSISMRGSFDFQILNFERMYLENTKTIQYNRLKSAYNKVFGKAVLSDQVDLEYNSYYIENGDYWKIDNITLGYNFKPSGTIVQSARVYISSLNTFILTGYKGIDPEVDTSGLSPGNDYRDKYPTTRTFTLGINLNF